MYINQNISINNANNNNMTKSKQLPFQKSDKKIKKKKIQKFGFRIASQMGPNLCKNIL